MTVWVEKTFGDTSWDSWSAAVVVVVAVVLLLLVFAVVGMHVDEVERRRALRERNRRRWEGR